MQQRLLAVRDVSDDSDFPLSGSYLNSPASTVYDDHSPQFTSKLLEYDPGKEDDDYLHDPDLGTGKSRVLGSRFFLNVGMVTILSLGVVTLFAGWPLLVALRRSAMDLSLFNSTGQTPSIPGVRTTLIDPDTPVEAHTRLSVDGHTQMQLVFSDEFNTNGRSFYAGEDPFWEAENLHYHATNNYEMYRGEAITTHNGSLVITLSEHPTNNLNFRGGLLTSWNKFCFQGGYIEVNAVLPGRPDVSGFWPAAWTASNLIRAG